MARRSEHSQEQIKEMVLGAAEAIVVKHGLQELTVRKIAMDIGYTVGSIYMVFANMQDLITHIKLRTLEQLAQQLQTKSSDAPDEQIQTIAEQYYNFAEQNFNRWQFLFEISQPPSELPLSYRQKIDQLLQPLISLLSQLRPQASSAELELAARGLWGAIHGISVYYLGGSLGRAATQDAQQALSLVVTHFIRGWQV